MIPSTPVLLVTGYLGSGKTTLVNHLLGNTQGVRFAVIVNDIGEVNIDASLIARGAVATPGQENLVALQNGCICCSLRSDLLEQISSLLEGGRFDYIVIEASGVCEPEPIAQTICSMGGMGMPLCRNGVARLDCIVTVVDALRMRDEFGCGDAIAHMGHEHHGGSAGHDVENLIAQQIEFANIVILNKISEVSAEDALRVEGAVRALQPGARIIRADHARVPIGELLDTHLFDFESLATSATWIKMIGEAPEELDGHHHHHHGHEDGHGHDHVAEYGISTFVYYRRRPFSLNEFDYFVSRRWPDSVIRTKGICYFTEEPDMTYVFEQAGKQKKLTAVGQWYATAPEDELRVLMESEPGLMRDWDAVYGDRMVKLVFIGRDMEREVIEGELDGCLGEYGGK